MLTFLVAALAASIAGAASLCNDKITTPHGNITAGQPRPDGGCAWFNIPFADPPVGSLRFAPPQSLSSKWAEFDASTPNNVACVQPDTSYGTSQEDCLYLIVYSSDGDITASHDVLFWIPGGGLLVGGAYKDIYSFVNRQPATNPLIVVTINYRVGPFGFFYDATLIDSAGSNPNDFAGNYGYLDTVQALTFINEVIASFGGDPSKITVFGQSSGAQLVSFMQLDTNAAGKYAATIMESNPWGALTKTPSMWWDIPQKYREALHCNNSVASAARDCLRGKTATELYSAIFAVYGLSQHYFFKCNFGLQWFTPFYATVGTPTLPYAAFKGFRDGHAADVLGIRGSNDDEMDTFIFQWFKTPLNMTQYLTQLGSWYYPKGLDVATYYEDAGVRAAFVPDPTTGDFRKLLSKVVTDGSFACPATVATQAMKDDSATADQFVYQFDYAWSDIKKMGLPTECNTVACHNSEIPFVFAPEDNRTRIAFSYTADELLLASNMQQFWAKVSDGSPGAAGYGTSAGVTWPEFGSMQASLRFVNDLTLTQETYYSRDNHHCEFWKEVNWPNLDPANDPGMCVPRTVLTKLPVTMAPTTVGPTKMPTTQTPTTQTPTTADGDDDSVLRGMATGALIVAVLNAIA